MSRRILLLGGGAIGLLSFLTGCGLFRTSKESVEDAVASAPSVLGVTLNAGPGGGLGTMISGTIELDVTEDALHDAFDGAWRRGVEEYHRQFDGDRGIPIASVTGLGTDGAEVSARDLVDLGESQLPTLGRFYDRYGIG